MPNIYRNIGGTWRTVQLAHRRINGIWKPCTVWRNTGGTWKRITGAQQLAANPVNAYGSNAATQSDITAIQGATFQFTLLSGSSTGVSFGSGSGTSTHVRLSPGNPGTIGSRAAVYRITDTLSGVYVDVSLNVDWDFVS